MLSPNGPRRAPPRARRPRRHDLGRRRARHRRRRCSTFLRADAFHAPRRAGAGHRRSGRVLIAGRARRADDVLTAAGLPGPGRATRARRSTAAASCAGCRPIGDGTRDRRSTCSSRGPSWPRGADALLAAGAALAGLAAYEALRVEARRPRAGRRHRPPDDPERAGVAAHRRPPGQGLLPRPGDGRPGAQPRPAAAAAGPAAPGRRERGAARARARRCSPAPARSAGSARWCATTSSASSRWRWSSSRWPMDAALTVAGSTAAIDPDDAPERRRTTTTRRRGPGRACRRVRSATIAAG